MILRALVLAGGASQRYAGNKLLSAHPAGGTLIEHVISAVTPLVSHTLVVTGKWHDALSAGLADKPVTVSRNDSWQAGMGTSIAHGVETIRTQWPDTTHVFICVGDLPAITAASLAQLRDVANHCPEHIVASTWLDTVGVPAVFPASYFSQLTTLSGDRGAGALIQQGLKTTPPTAIAVPHPEAGWDIDEPRDWQTARDE